MFLDIADKITGIIDKELFNRLPGFLKEEFLEKVRITSSPNESLCFEIPDREGAEELYSKVRKYEKNQNHSEIRKENLYILSSGIYEKEDIDALYKAQEGLCYYTGKPIEKKPKNYAIDHIIPVTECGSSWPENLALATIDINRRKHNYSKRKIFSILEKQNGKEWIKTQREFCKVVDKKRRSIDKKRRHEVSEKLSVVEREVREYFPREDIEYALVEDDIELSVNYTIVKFAAGFIRQKKKCLSTTYIKKIIYAIVTQSN